MRRLCGPAMVLALTAIAAGASSHARHPAERRCFTHRAAAHSCSFTPVAARAITHDRHNVAVTVERRASGELAIAGGEPP